MIRFVPKDYTQLGKEFCEDEKALGYIGYDLSDDNKECGKSVFHLSGYDMSVDFVEAKDNDKEIIEGLIRSSLNYGANRGAYIANYKAENGIDVAKTLGFEKNKAVLTGEIPVLLAGSCCKK